MKIHVRCLNVLADMCVGGGCLGEQVYGSGFEWVGDSKQVNERMLNAADEVINLVNRRKQLIHRGSQPSDIMVVSLLIQNASLHLMNCIRTLLIASNIPSADACGEQIF